MKVERMALAVPVSDMAVAVERWSRLLGTTPAFVDGERWAQFDVQGMRVCLAGTDRCSVGPALMLKVPDLDAAMAEASRMGANVSGRGHGPHEERATACWDDGITVVFYRPRPLSD